MGYPQARSIPSSGTEYRSERLATFERIGARLPVGRVGRPEDIAEACLYLIKTGFSPGETIVVDGGALQAVS
jgi:NAD(P)-dependent dehydrogenase (short-subunit alcohol dehydrogenase family)